MDVEKLVAEMKRKAEQLADEAAELQGFPRRDLSAEFPISEGPDVSDADASPEASPA